MILGEPRAMRDVLCRLGAGQPFTRKRLFDVLATTGECHHLFARVAVKLPSPVLFSDLDFVSEPLNLASQLGTIDGGGTVLRTIDLNWIKPMPLPARGTGHCGEYHMRAF